MAYTHAEQFFGGCVRIPTASLPATSWTMPDSWVFPRFLMVTAKSANYILYLPSAATVPRGTEYWIMNTSGSYTLKIRGCASIYDGIALSPNQIALIACCSNTSNLPTGAWAMAKWTTI